MYRRILVIGDTIYREVGAARSDIGPAAFGPSSQSTVGIIEGDRHTEY